jgi:hypothetical protein
METTTLDHVLAASQQLSPADQLRLIGLLSEQLRDKLDAQAPAIDLLSQAGLGAELWQEIDVDAYIEQERASWDN